jgi:hypothetical protein
MLFIIFTRIEQIKKTYTAIKYCNKSLASYPYDPDYFHNRDDEPYNTIGASYSLLFVKQTCYLGLMNFTIVRESSLTKLINLVYNLFKPMSINSMLYL